MVKSAEHQEVKGSQQPLTRTTHSSKSLDSRLDGSSSSRGCAGPEERARVQNQDVAPLHPQLNCSLCSRTPKLESTDHFDNEEVALSELPFLMPIDGLSESAHPRPVAFAAAANDELKERERARQTASRLAESSSSHPSQRDLDRERAAGADSREPWPRASAAPEDRRYSKGYPRGQDEPC